MAILKIARMGHPVLRRPAAVVADPTAPEITVLVNDMIETMDDAGGIGLAAPQVHVGLRLVIFSVPAARVEGEGADGDAKSRPVPLTVLINPVIEPLSSARDVAWEACLSVPGLMGAVPRFVHIRYSGVTLAGDPIDVEATGFHARVVQHECDHLDGILYPQRMEDLSTLGFAEEMAKGKPPLPTGEEV